MSPSHSISSYTPAHCTGTASMITILIACTWLHLIAHAISDDPLPATITGED